MTKLDWPTPNEVVGVVERFLEGLNTLLEKLTVGFETGARLLPKLEARVPELAQEGWFISGLFGFSELQTLASQIDTLAPLQLDVLLRDMYRQSLQEHTDVIVKDYPHRAFVIRPGVDAHLRGEYGLSVLAFFSQADGICFDWLQKQIFMRSDELQAHAKEKIETLVSSPELAQWDMITPFIRLMWQPLAEKLPIGFNPKTRKANQYCGLNRNTVMHGEALDYATEENSLKAFSLLSFIAAAAQFSSFPLDGAEAKASSQV